MHKSNYVRSKTVRIVPLSNVYYNGYIEINKGMWRTAGVSYTNIISGNKTGNEMN